MTASGSRWPVVLAALASGATLHADQRASAAFRSGDAFTLSISIALFSLGAALPLALATRSFFGVLGSGIGKPGADCGIKPRVVAGMADLHAGRSGLPLVGCACNRQSTGPGDASSARHLGAGVRAARRGAALSPCLC